MTQQHSSPEIKATSASQPGALAGFSTTCSCGLVMANTMKVNVELDVRQHEAYFAAKERKAH